MPQKSLDFFLNFLHAFPYCFAELFLAISCPIRHLDLLQCSLVVHSEWSIVMESDNRHCTKMSPLTTFSHLKCSIFLSCPLLSLLPFRLFRQLSAFAPCSSHVLRPSLYLFRGSSATSPSGQEPCANCPTANRCPFLSGPRCRFQHNCHSPNSGK